MSNIDQQYEAAIAEAKRNRRVIAGQKWSVGDVVFVKSRSLAAAGLSDYNNRPGVITEASARRDGSMRYTVIVEASGPSKYREISAGDEDLHDLENAPREEPFETIEDRKGNRLRPGDRVRIRLYPKGTLEGIVVVNPTKRVVLRSGGTKQALSVKDEVDGTLYELNSKGALKIR
jgi:hypothetical protein